MKTLIAIIGTTVLLSGNANAGLITQSFLSSHDDGSTQVITDTLNNREWLRWDVLPSLSYAQTVDAISPGGAFEGFHIAFEEDATLFLNALDPFNTCSDTINSIQNDCAKVAIPGLLGDNFTRHYDMALFRSGLFVDDNSDEEVGTIETHQFFNQLILDNEAFSIEDSDLFSGWGEFSALFEEVNQAAQESSEEVDELLEEGGLDGEVLGVDGPFSEGPFGLDATWLLWREPVDVPNFQNINVLRNLGSFIDEDFVAFEFPFDSLPTYFPLEDQPQSLLYAPTQLIFAAKQTRAVYSRLISTVPEPSTVTLFGLALFGLGLSRLRKSKKAFSYAV